MNLMHFSLPVRALGPVSVRFLARFFVGDCGPVSSQDLRRNLFVKAEAGEPRSFGAKYLRPHGRNFAAIWCQFASIEFGADPQTNGSAT